MHDDGYYTALCWLEIITLKEHKNGSSEVGKEYAILLETPGDIPGEYLEKRKYNDEVIPYELIDDDTKKSRVVNFTRVDVSKDLTVLENRKMLCASGPVYTKEYIEWPKSTKKRIEFKVSPKKEAVLVVKPVVRVEKKEEEPRATDHLPSTSQKESVKVVTEEEAPTTIRPFNISATDVPKIDEQQVAREAVSESVMYKNTDIKNNGTDNRKKKKKLVSETESTKRISMYHSTIRNELDGGHNNQPITRKYVLETTVTNQPSNNSAADNEMESQPSYSNSIISLPPHPPRDITINSFCARDKEHVLLLRINVVMEHKVIPRKGDAFFLPVVTMEKQVEFDVHPNSINKSESVTLLSVNEKWRNLLSELTHGENQNQHRYSTYDHYNSGGFSNSVSVDEATNYVTELQNSLESCPKFVKNDLVARRPKEKERQLRKRKINTNTADLPNVINQPTAKESNKSLVVTDVKRNLSSEAYIIEKLMDPQPSDTNSKHVVPGVPIRHVRTFKRIVIHGDDPENAQVEEYAEVGGDVLETTTIAPMAETVPQTPSVPDVTTVTKVVPIVNNSEVPEGNIFVRVLGTLSTILRRLAV